ncbi:MAG: DUF6551 family protein [Pseudomonadota bacterium]
MRAIDPAPYQPALKGAGPLGDMGAVPMLQWLPVAHLRVDPAYQREILGEGRRTVLAIARGFEWCKFAPVVVAPIEGGLYAVIDGQHRTTAAALRGAEQVPCLVVIADRARQAEAFAAINGQVTKISSMAVYHARVAAGDAEALKVAEICAQADVTILRSNQSAKRMKRGETIGASTLIQALARFGGETLALALKCVTWTAEGNPGMLGKPVIEGLCIALDAVPEWRADSGAVLDEMDDFDFPAELQAARATCNGGGQSLSAAFAGRVTAWLTAKLGVPEPAQAAE